MARRKRHSRSSRKSVSSSRKVIASKDKMKMILWNLVLSVILSIISAVLYKVVSNELLKNFFAMLGLIFGLVALAFLIIYAIFVVLRILKK